MTNTILDDYSLQAKKDHLYTKKLVDEWDEIRSAYYLIKTGKADIVTDSKTGRKFTKIRQTS